MPFMSSHMQVTNSESNTLLMVNSQHSKVTDLNKQSMGCNAHLTSGDYT